MALKITPESTDDRKALEEIVNELQRKGYVDKGVVGKDIQKLWEKEEKSISAWEFAKI